MGLYKISKKFKGKERSKIHTIIKNGMDKNLSSTAIINNLKEKKLSYNDKNMRYDIRLKKASYNIGVKKDGNITYSTPKSRISRIRKQKWFMDTFERFRIENKLSVKRARILIKQEMVTSHKNNDEIELGQKFYDIYKSVFA